MSYFIFVKMVIVLGGVVFFAALLLSVVRTFKEGVSMEKGFDVIVFLFMFSICVYFYLN